MATFYFNAAVDNDWNTLGNWWADAAFTIPAASLPTSIDDVVIEAVSVSSNSGESQASVATFVMNDPDGDEPVLGVAVTTTGGATFNGSAKNEAQIYGDVTFNDTSRNNFGTTYGMATFNDYAACSSGSLAGQSTFNDNTYNEYGLIFGDSTFNDNAGQGGFSVAPVTFNGSSQQTATGLISNSAVFNDNSSNSGTVEGTAVFNDSSYNNGGAATGDVTLRGNASSSGTIGNPYASTSVINLYDNSFIVEGSTVGAATITFHDSSYGAVQNTSYYGAVSFANRTPYPIPRGINGSSILGVI